MPRSSHGGPLGYWSDKSDLGRKPPKFQWLRNNRLNPPLEMSPSETEEIFCHTLSKRAPLLQTFLFNYLYILFLVNLIWFSRLSKCHEFYSHIGTEVNIWKGERLYLSLIDFVFNNVVNKVCPLNQSKAIPLWTLNASSEPCCFHYIQFTHYFQFLEKYFNISRALLIYYIKK